MKTKSIIKSSSEALRLVQFITIGLLLEQRRESMGITIHQIRKSTGLSFLQVRSILDGNKNYTINSLVKLSRVLNMKLEIEGGNIENFPELPLKVL